MQPVLKTEFSAPEEFRIKADEAEPITAGKRILPDQMRL